MASSKKGTSDKEDDDTFQEQYTPKGKLDLRQESRTSSSLEFMKHSHNRRESSAIELIVMITKETQTDWEWADVQAKQAGIEVKDIIKVDFDANKAGTPPPVVTPLENLRTAGIQVDLIRHQSATIAIQAFEAEENPHEVPEIKPKKANTSSVKADSVVPEPYLELKMSRQETQLTSDTPISHRRQHGGATPVQEPWPPRSPLYGRPIMMPDDYDFDLIESPKKEVDVDIDENGSSKLLAGLSSKDNKLPHLALPASLQIKKDSQEVPLRSREEFQQLLAESAAQPAANVDDGTGSDVSFTNLVCEFCQQQLRPFPTLEQQRTSSSSELYCCDDYRKFVEFVLTTDDTFEQELKRKLMGSQPQETPAEGQQQKRDEQAAAKAKAMKQLSNRASRQNADDERRHRQELERHLAMLEKAKKMRETQLKDSKQVKTIQFQLSKYRCYEQGMVILPPDFHLSEMEQFQYKRMQAALAEQAAMQQRRQVADMDGLSHGVEVNNSGDFVIPQIGDHSYLLDSGVPVIKKYDDKITTFLVLLGDGTSTVFYPSGQIAITVSSFNGVRTFTAFDDAPGGKGRILALFMSSGFGTVYTNDGTIRLTMTPAAGFEINPVDGSKRRKWSWAEVVAGNHVHAPPFQCIFYHLNSYLSVRIGDYQDWTLTFFYRQFRCRFNVMAFTPFEIVEPNSYDMSDIRLVRLNKCRSQFIESHSKLKAVMREINYMLGLVPSNTSHGGGISFSLTKSMDAKGDQAGATTSRKKNQPGNKTARHATTSFLPPLVAPTAEV